MRKLLISALVAFSAISVARANSPDEYVWSGNHPNDKRASVSFGIPETGAILFTASCIRKHVIYLSLQVEPKHLATINEHVKQKVTLVKVGNDPFRFIGELFENEGEGAWELSAYVTPDLPLLQRLTRDDRSKLIIGNLAIPLNRKSATEIGITLKKCG
uniref:Uncharacterized protein n=1 Tax=Bosea sp. NBC_00436 TaxID=2969620 RepID=A0A9E8CQM5_9HYPH